MPLNESVSLGYLQHAYGAAYDIRMRRGQLEARRRDDGSMVRADTADAMLAELREDYAARPVSRDVTTWKRTP
jgi:hypothetical protein